MYQYNTCEGPHWQHPKPKEVVCLHEPQCKDGSDTYFHPLRHVQAPHSADRQRQKDDIFSSIGKSLSRRTFRNWGTLAWLSPESGYRSSAARSNVEEEEGSE